MFVWMTSKLASFHKPIPLQICLNKQLQNFNFSLESHFTTTTNSLKHNINHKSIAAISVIEEGLSIHAFIVKFGLEFNVYIMNSLVEMYARFGRIENARQVFDKMPLRNLVSWNLMVSGYKACSGPKLALEFCSLMKHGGVGLDKVGLKIVLPLCGQAGALRAGESLHARVITLCLSYDSTVLTAILDMYAECGRLDAAEQLFKEIIHRDVVCWNAMITRYLQSGKADFGLEFFKEMLAENFKPSIPTILLSLKACTKLSALQTGKCIHGFITRIGFGSDVSVFGLLIDMYSKCGELEAACCISSGIFVGGVNTWSCIINGLGMHGYGKEALMCFFQMLKKGIEPDGVCFLLILSSCSHNGLIEEGKKMFHLMVEQFKIHPTMAHYGSMVDLMGRSGLLEEAFEFICRMPVVPDSSVVGAFLGACRIHEHLEMKRVAEWLVDSERSIAGFYKLLLGIHASTDRWEEVVKIRKSMEEKRLKGISGCSVIESNR